MSRFYEAQWLSCNGQTANELHLAFTIRTLAESIAIARNDDMPRKTRTILERNFLVLRRACEQYFGVDDPSLGTLQLYNPTIGKAFTKETSNKCTTHDQR